MSVADIPATVAQMTAMAIVRCVLPIMSSTREVAPRIEATILSFSMICCLSTRDMQGLLSSTGLSTKACIIYTILA